MLNYLKDKNCHQIVKIKASEVYIQSNFYENINYKSINKLITKYNNKNSVLFLKNLIIMCANLTNSETIRIFNKLFNKIKRNQILLNSYYYIKYNKNVNIYSKPPLITKNFEPIYSNLEIPDIYDQKTETKPKL